MRAHCTAASTLPRPPWLQSKARTDASERHETAGGCKQGATLGLGIGALRFQLLELRSQGVPFLLKVGGRFELRLHKPEALQAQSLDAGHSTGTVQALYRYSIGTVQALDAGSDSHELASTEISP